MGRAVGFLVASDTVLLDSVEKCGVFVSGVVGFAQVLRTESCSCIECAEFGVWRWRHGGWWRRRDCVQDISVMPERDVGWGELWSVHRDCE